MKKLFMILMLLCLVGCNKNNEETTEALLDYSEQIEYLNNKYGMEFTIDNARISKEVVVYDRETFTKGVEYMDTWSSTSNSDRKFYVYRVVGNDILYDNYSETQIALGIEEELQEIANSFTVADYGFSCYVVPTETIIYDKEKSINDYKGVNYDNIELSIYFNIEDKQAVEVFNENVSQLYDMYNYIKDFSGSNVILNVGFIKDNETLKYYVTDKYSFDSNFYYSSPEEDLYGYVFVDKTDKEIDTLDEFYNLFVNSKDVSAPEGQ